MPVLIGVCHFFPRGDQILKATYSPHVVFWCVHFGVFNLVFRKYFFSWHSSSMGLHSHSCHTMKRVNSSCHFCGVKCCWLELDSLEVPENIVVDQHHDFRNSISFLYCCSDILISWLLPYIPRCPLKLHLLWLHVSQKERVVAGRGMWHGPDIWGPCWMATFVLRGHHSELRYIAIPSCIDNWEMYSRQCLLSWNWGIFTKKKVKLYILI